MSASEFDDLLGDFGNGTTITTTTTTTTTKTTSFDDIGDDFDPFRPSQSSVQTSHGENFGLLLDLSPDDEIKNGENPGSSNTSSPSTNPFYNMSKEDQSSNPLYDLASPNLLYEFSTDGDTNESSSTIYKFSSESKVKSSPSNPLYDLETDYTTNEAAEEADLLSGTNEQEEEDDDDRHSSHSNNDFDDSHGDSEAQQEEVVEHEVLTVEYAPRVLNGAATQWVEQHDDDLEESQPQQESDDGDDDDYSGHVHVVEEVRAGDKIPAEEEDTRLENSTRREEEAQEERSSLSPSVQTVDSLYRSAIRLQEDSLNARRTEQCPKLVVSTGNVEKERITVADRRDTAYEEVRRVQQGQQRTEYYSHEVDDLGSEESDTVGVDSRLDRLFDRLKPREERSRPPSRSIGRDSPVSAEIHEPSGSLDSDTADENDTLRPREDRSNAPSRSLEPEDRQKEEEVIDGGRTVSRITRIETRRSGPDVEQTQSSVDFSNKQWEEEKNRQNVDLSRHSGGQGHVSVYEVTYNKSEPTPAPRKHFESQKEVHATEAGVYESQPQSYQQWQNQEEEEGVYENQPAKRDDVYREADSDKTADLPARGTAQSMRAKFMSAQQESTTWSKHEISPSDFGAGGEYVSEPRSHIERYEGRAESGVFESQPVVIPGVVTASSVTEEATYESGFARNTAAKFRELQKRSSISSTHREVSPDRSGPGEYVSEPRGHVEIYEGKAESGVFESEPVVNPDVVRSGEEVQDQLPEKGMARNLASKFLQFSAENKSLSSGGSRSKKETVATEYSAQAEYVSEPRSQHTSDYVAKVDAGVFENQPQRSADVVTSDSVPEDYIPERGFARNVAAKFRELESSMKSPPQSPGRRKEFTPPREDDRFHQAAVAENRPEYKPDIIHSADQQEETLPEVGMARNMAQRFRQMEFENKGSQPSGTRAQKEFTPPPRDSGVYENQPKQFYADYNRPAESGVIENEPVRRDDVVRGDEPPRYEEELPERGAAKNLVNRWRQMEAEGAKLKSPGSSGRPKEFTPPREEPRLAQQRKTPHSPASPTSHGRLDNGAVHPYDLPGQYQPQNEASVSESSPQQRSDVVREADTDWSDGMPLKDTAKKMLARFQSLETEAGKQQQASAPRRETETPIKAPRKDSQNSETEYYHTMENTKQNVEDENKVGRSKSMRAAVQMEKCGACEKTVYAMERLEMNKRVYHKACFRCTQCKAVLTPKTFAINNEVIFCTTHYKQLFATKGNYDEGFGRTQHKKRWNSNPNLAKDAEEDGKS